MTVTIPKAEDFPIVDFSKFDSQPEEVSQEIFEAAGRWGFLVLTGHGIAQEDVDEIFAMVNSITLHIMHPFHSKTLTSI
jgi:isopenicillin N synthase-like dioxygenase